MFYFREENLFSSLSTSATGKSSWIALSMSDRKNEELIWSRQRGNDVGNCTSVKLYRMLWLLRTGNAGEDSKMTAPFHFVHEFQKYCNFIFSSLNALFVASNFNDFFTTLKKICKHVSWNAGHLSYFFNGDLPKYLEISNGFFGRLRIFDGVWTNLRAFELSKPIRYSSQKVRKDCLTTTRSNCDETSPLIDFIANFTCWSRFGDFGPRVKNVLWAQKRNKEFQGKSRCQWHMLFLIQIEIHANVASTVRYTCFGRAYELDLGFGKILYFLFTNRKNWFGENRAQIWEFMVESFYS